MIHGPGESRLSVAGLQEEALSFIRVEMEEPIAVSINKSRAKPRVSDFRMD